MSIWAEVGPAGAGRRATRVDGPMGALPGWWWIAQHPGGWTGWGDDAVSICSTSILRTVPSLVHVCRFLCIVVEHEMVRFCNLDSPQHATAKIGQAEQVQPSRVWLFSFPQRQSLATHCSSLYLFFGCISYKSPSNIKGVFLYKRDHVATI